MTNKNARRFAPLSAAMIAATCLSSAVLVSATAAMARAGGAGEVNVYSFRQPYLIRPLLRAFTKKSGIKVNVIFAKKGLIERAAAEGRNSPADVLLTSDIGRLTGAVAKGITQPVHSAVLNKQIPPAYRSAKGDWFGLTKRARIVFASKTRVRQNKITYEQLADPKWRGRICVRSGQHVYNIALIASMIAHHGKAKTKAWLMALKNNLARKPSGNDRSQVKAVYAGVCDIAIGNTYYMAKMQLNDKRPVQKKWAASVKMLFPNAGGRGTHINISGMVMAKYAPHRQNAVKLMEYLASDEAQAIYAAVNNEYPVSPAVKPSHLVQSWGALNADPIALETIAKYRNAASQMVDEVGFNNGPSS